MSFQPGVCQYCGTGCGHILQVEAGSVRGVFPSPSHPVGRGRLCVRGWHIHELLNSEDRIVRPLIRKQESLAAATWDEALSTSVSRLSGFRGEEIGFWASPRSSNEDVFALVRLARATFRSPHISLQSDVRYRSTAEVFREGTGWPAGSGTLTDIRSANFILIVGTDLTRQNPIVASEIHFASRSGADVVMVGSRTTPMAKLSGTHLRIHPGTKNLVLAALAKVLLEENRWDASFVSASTEGFEEFRKSLDSLRLQAVEAATGLSIETIKAVARRLAAAPRALAVFSTGMTGFSRDTAALVSNLFLAAGKIGRDGCGIITLTGISNLAGANDMGAAPDLLPGWRRLPDESAAAEFQKLWGTEVNARAGRAIEELLAATPTPLKALVVVDHDPETNLLTPGIKSLEFVLYLGAFANPFMDLAHVVLPTPTHAETDGTMTNTERRIQLNRRKTEPRFEARPAWRIYADISARLGRPWPYRTSADIQEEITRIVPAYGAATYPNLAARFGGLQWPCDPAHPQGTPRLDLSAEGGKLRFVPSGSDFEGPASSADYPFRLMAGKSYYYWHQNNLMKKTFIPKREYNALLLLYPQGLIDIHPADAEALGVRDKRPVRVVSALGRMIVQARVTEDVPPGTVYAPYFIGSMIPEFLAPQAEEIDRGEDAVIPVRIEKV
jgi:predicted molibdopterin-dependent oxidoreductase YjgC